MPDNASIPVIGRQMFTGRPIYGYRRGENGQERVPITDPDEYWRYYGLGQVTGTGFGPGDRTIATPDEANQFLDDQRYQDILGIYRGAAQNAQNQFNEQGDYLQGTIGEVNNLGEAARGRIMDTERRQLGAVGSSLRSRGLGGTTVLDNARRGVYGDTNRSLTDLNESVTGMRVGARNRLSDFMQNRTSAETGLQLAQAEPRQRRSDIYHALQMARIAAASGGSGGGNALGAILPIAGGILGGIFGGPGGAAAGGAIGSGFNRAFGQY